MPPAASPEQAERRSILLAGAGIFGALLVLVLVAIVFNGGAGDPSPTASPTTPCAPGDEACLAAQHTGQRPGIIPRPGEGQAPTDPGQRGGWAQVALLGLILAAVATITVGIVRSTHRARRRDANDPADVRDPSNVGDGTALGRAP